MDDPNVHLQTQTPPPFLQDKIAPLQPSTERQLSKEQIWKAPGDRSVRPVLQAAALSWLIRLGRHER